ncbi:MAG: cell division protein FtsB [Coxiellaceae bacterium]|nr:MAG: cell division protein FtsB [Coxiellaceae bacterium]
MRILVFLLVALLIGLQYLLWFGDGGLVQVWRQQRAIAAITTDNEQLLQRNNILQADVQDLKQGQEAIEERARNDLGMIKQNETFYQFNK